MSLNLLIVSNRKVSFYKEPSKCVKAVERKFFGFAYLRKFSKPAHIFPVTSRGPWFRKLTVFWGFSDTCLVVSQSPVQGGADCEIAQVLRLPHLGNQLLGPEFLQSLPHFLGVTLDPGLLVPLRAAHHTCLASLAWNMPCPPPIGNHSSYEKSGKRQFRFLSSMQP